MNRIYYNILASFVLLCFFLIAPTISFCQRVVTEFELPSNDIDEIQAFELGDSVFLTFTSRTGEGSRSKQGYWIHEKEKSQPVDLNNLKGSMMLGITEDSTALFYYVLEARENLAHVKMIRQEISSNTFHVPFTVYSEFNLLLSTRVEKNALELLSYDKQQNAIIRTLITGTQVAQDVLAMPFDVSNDLKSFSGVLSKDPLPSIAQGAEKMKVTIEGDSIFFSIDRPYNNHDSKTIVCRTSLRTKQSVVSEIAGPPGMRFTSVYRDGILYRLLVDPKFFKIETYDIKGLNALSSTLFTKKNTRADHVVYQQDLDSRKTDYSNIHTLIEYGAFNATSASLLVESATDGSTILTIGSFYKNGRGVISSFANPLVAIGTFLVTQAIAKISEPSGTYRYTYVMQVPKGLVLTERPNSIRQVIDEYEAQRNVNVKSAVDKWYLYLKFKTHIPLHDGALGLYHESKKASKKLIVMKFQMSRP